MTVRKVFYGAAAVAILAVAVGVGNNNLPAASISRAEWGRALDQSLTASSEWMLAQEREPNVYLTYMVQDCATLSGDARLAKFVDRTYMLNPDPPSLRLLNPQAPFQRPAPSYEAQLGNYQRWILHAISKKEYPLTDADLAEMLEPDKHRTGRATHQLFALLLYRRFNGDTPELQALTRRICERIAQEEAIDFRVTDLYLQRIAFLLAAGQPDLVRPRWVERAMAAQSQSGGWYHGWFGWQPTPYKLGYDEWETSHPTAQGLWMACMLKYRYPQWAAAHYK